MSDRRICKKPIPDIFGHHPWGMQVFNRSWRSEFEVLEKLHSLLSLRGFKDLQCRKLQVDLLMHDPTTVIMCETKRESTFNYVVTGFGQLLTYREIFHELLPSDKVPIYAIAANSPISIRLGQMLDDYDVIFLNMLEPEEHIWRFIANKISEMEKRWKGE